MSSNTTCLQSVDADISGIGVRLSFYLQNFLLVILVDRSWQDAPSALWTFIATSFGLTVSAIHQAKTQQLSFFQALQVTNLCWLANFGTFLALATFSRHRRHDKKTQKLQEAHTDAGRKKVKQQRKIPEPFRGNYVKVAATCQTLLTMALTIFTWAKPDAFVEQGVDSEGQTCTPPPVNYVAFFAANFPAETSGKILGLTMSSILVVVYLLITAHELHSSLSHRVRPHGPYDSDVEAQLEPLRKLSKDLPDIPQLILTPAPADPDGSQEGVIEMPVPSSSASAFPPGWSSLGPSTRTISSMSLPIPPRSPSPSATGRPTRPRHLRLFPEIDPMLLGIIIGQIPLVYFVTVSELLLVRNPTANANEWGFGQVLALILVVPSLVSVQAAFSEHGIGRLHHKSKKSRHHRGMSNASQTSHET